VVFWFILLSGFLGFGAGIGADTAPIQVTAEVDYRVLGLDEDVTYTVQIVRPRGAARKLELKRPRFVGFEWVDLTSHRQSDPRRVTDEFRYRLRPRRPGEWTIPPATVTFRLPGHSEPQSLATAPVTVKVVAFSDRSELRDLKPLAEVKAPPSGNLVVGSLGAGLVLLFLGWHLHRRRAEPRAVSLPPAPPARLVPPAPETALQELEDLRGAGLEMDPHYVRLSQILRRYLAGRYGVPALESTTLEIQEGLHAAHLPEDLIHHAVQILRHCDREKFAGFQPSPAEREADLAAAIRFVEITQPQRSEGVRGNFECA